MTGRLFASQIFTADVYEVSWLYAEFLATRGVTGWIEPVGDLHMRRLKRGALCYNNKVS